MVASSDDMDTGPVSVRLLGDDYVVWRDETGSPVAAADRCPHREAPLSAGSVSNGRLECCYHGWVFGAGGRCEAIPSAGEGVPVPPKAHLSILHATERYGLVWMCPGEPVLPVPGVSEDEDPGFRRINTEVQVWKVGATRMVDNLSLIHI